MKNLLTIALLLFITLNANAQDVIVKKDGSTILSKITEVGTTEIKYKKWSNQNGPNYTILKAEILSINYENGDKDTFADEKPLNKEEESDHDPHLLKTVVGENNAELIDTYNNQDVHFIQDNKNTSKNAAYEVIILNVGKESVLNNTDLEISFRPAYRDPWGHIYCINIKNLTDKTIHIDKGNSFKIDNEGGYKTYYSNTATQTTTGSGKGIGLNLGSVAGVLGIGGVLGTLAGGVNIGRSSQVSTSTISFSERIISLPPHASCEFAETMFYGSVYRDLTIGEDVEYTEENSPEKYEYIITYSKNINFDTYGTINATLFIAKRIGINQGRIRDSVYYNVHKKITGINENTLWSVDWIIK